MPRGKKFDAAQKYIEKRVKGYNQTINSLRQQLAAEKKYTASVARRNQLLTEENEILRTENEELKKLYGLSEPDVRALVDKAKSVAVVTSLVTGMPRVFE